MPRSISSSGSSIDPLKLTPTGVESSDDSPEGEAAQARRAASSNVAGAPGAGSTFGATSGERPQSERVMSFVDPREIPAPESIQESLESDEHSGEGVFAEESKILDVKARLDEKARAQKTRLLRRILVITGIVVVIGVVAWILFFSPLCRVKSETVSVTGTNRWVSKSQVTKISDRYINKSVLLVSSGKISEDLKKLPGVKDVSISKGFPDSLTLHVEPRVPKAIIKDDSGTLSVVDDEGSVIATVDEQFAGVPLIEVKNTDKELTSRAVKQALSVLSQVPNSLLSTLVQVTAMTQDSVTTQTADGHTIIWGNSSEMKLKSVVVQRLLADPQLLGGKKSIDVSAPKRPILK